VPMRAKRLSMSGVPSCLNTKRWQVKPAFDNSVSRKVNAPPSYGVTDGQRIPVVKVGQPGVIAPTAASGGTGTDPAGSDASGPVDLNTATPTQLDALPGVGPSLAAAIIGERERRGGFTSVDQLREVRGIGDKRFADLKPLVTV